MIPQKSSNWAKKNTHHLLANKWLGNASVWYRGYWNPQKSELPWWVEVNGIRLFRTGDVVLLAKKGWQLQNLRDGWGWHDGIGAFFFLNQPWSSCSGGVWKSSIWHSGKRTVVVFQGSWDTVSNPSYSVDYTCFHPKRLISEWISRLKTLQKGSFRISPILQ